MANSLVGSKGSAGKKQSNPSRITRYFSPSFFLVFSRTNFKRLYVLASVSTSVPWQKKGYNLIGGPFNLTDWPGFMVGVVQLGAPTNSWASPSSKTISTTLAGFLRICEAEMLNLLTKSCLGICKFLLFFYNLFIFSCQSNYPQRKLLEYSYGFGQIYSTL